TRGLLSRSKGVDGWRLGKDASDDVYSLWRDQKISTDKAVAIASAAPGDANLQSLGIKQAIKGRSVDEIENFIKAVGVETADAPEQVDLFGRDDRAIKKAEEMAARATEFQSQLREQIRAVQGAAKRPELAAKLGVDIKDPEAVLKRTAELKAEAARWQNWPVHPDLVAKVGDKSIDLVAKVGEQLVEEEKKATPPPKAPASGELFGAEEIPFNLTGETPKLVPPKNEQTKFGGETLSQ